MKRLLAALIVVGAAGGVMAPASAAPRAAVPLSSALAPLLAAGAPGAVALSRHDDVIERAAVGLADVRARRPMRPGDRLRVGSITKTFVAVVVLQLVDEGRLRLDDTVARWLPGVLPYGAEVSVRQLLSHTAGIPEFMTSVADFYRRDPKTYLAHWAPRRLVDLAAARPRLFPPGEGWAYSNTGYVLLGMIIERVVGRPLDRVLHERILDPAGLRHTTFARDAVLAAPPAARGYLPDGHGKLVDATEWNASVVWAAGALVSTVNDLMRFHKALFTGALLPPARRAEMLSYRSGSTLTYGLGVYRIDTPCGPAVGHNGGVYGYVTDVFTSPDGTRQVVIGVNTLAAEAIAAQQRLIPALFCR